MSPEEKHCEGGGTLWQVERKSEEGSKDTLAKCLPQTAYTRRKWLSNDFQLCPYDFDIQFILNLKETFKLLKCMHFNICNSISLVGNIFHIPPYMWKSLFVQGLM